MGCGFQVACTTSGFQTLCMSKESIWVKCIVKLCHVVGELLGHGELLYFSYYFTWQNTVEN